MSVPAGPEGVPVPALALVILDGWGLAPAGPGNAVSLASTPVFDALWRDYPHAEQACLESIALPIFPELSEADQERVVHAVANYVRQIDAGTSSRRAA